MLSKKQIEESINEIKSWNNPLEKSVRQGKYSKMAGSPYYFFRGTNHLFWKYFAHDRRMQIFSSKKSNTWLQGDLHAYNYGIYEDASGDLVYGMNDFDESCVANYQFDLWRMASSIVLIANENEFTDKDIISDIIYSFSSDYIDAFRNYIAEGHEVLVKVTKDNAYGKLDESIEQVEDKESRKKMLKQWTKHENGTLKFDLSYEKLDGLDNKQKHEIEELFIKYEKRIRQSEQFATGYFEILDIAHRVSSGTGSYGTPRYYILIKGNSHEEHGQRILDIKRQSKPSSYVFLGEKFRNQYDKNFTHEGIRHQQAYQALNYYVDKHLSWIELPEGMFSVRERSPYKSYFQTQLLNSEQRFKKLAKQWGYILASSHIKSNQKFDVKETYKLINNNKDEFYKLVKNIALEFANYNDELYSKFIDKLFLKK